MHPHTNTQPYLLITKLSWVLTFLQVLTSALASGCSFNRMADNVNTNDKSPPTAFALLNHVHSLASLEVDLGVLLPLVVGNSHVLLQHHRLWALDPWGEETRRQPPAGRRSTWTAPTAHYVLSAVGPASCHRLTPRPIRRRVHAAAASSQLAIKRSQPPAHSEGMMNHERNQTKGGRAMSTSAGAASGIYQVSMTWVKGLCKKNARQKKNREMQQSLAASREVWWVEEWGSFPVENQQCGWEERPPSAAAAAGKRLLDSELGRRGVERTNHGSRHCWP